jgi:hypothetical protein
MPADTAAAGAQLLGRGSGGLASERDSGEMLGVVKGPGQLAGDGSDGTATSNAASSDEAARSFTAYRRSRELQLQDTLSELTRRVEAQRQFSREHHGGLAPALNPDVHMDVPHAGTGAGPGGPAVAPSDPASAGGAGVLASGGPLGTGSGGNSPIPASTMVARPSQPFVASNPRARAAQVWHASLAWGGVQAGGAVPL